MLTETQKELDRIILTIDDLVAQLEVLKEQSTEKEFIKQAIRKIEKGTNILSRILTRG